MRRLFEHTQRRRSRRQAPVVLAVLVGAAFGLAVSMCVQSLACLPVQSAPPSADCARPPLGGRRLSSVLLTPAHSPAPTHRQLLLVGVMTANKFLHTRARAVWRTWAQTIPGKLIFFVAENTVVDESLADLPIVRLKGADDSYPPQKKSFLMLRWMADFGLDQFEWFMRADDDLYVRGDRLELFLRSIDHNRLRFVGQAGRGTAQEYGTLSLAEDENYCMGGPGILLSSKLLRTVRPHLAECLQNMYTTHEDVEVGRCVKRHARIACTWSYEVKPFIAWSR